MYRLPPKVWGWEYACPLRLALGRSIRHVELAVVLVAVGEGDGDHVAACAGEVGGEAVGGPNGGVVDPIAHGGGDIDLDCSEVLGEGYREGMAVDIGQDGVGSGIVLDFRSLDVDIGIAIDKERITGTTPNRR